MSNTDFCGGIFGNSGSGPQKFNKMYEVPHLGQNNAICQERLGTAWLSRSPPGKDLEVARDVMGANSVLAANGPNCTLAYF